MSKCAIDETTKYYIIPTRKWLKPIEVLLTEDYNTAGLLMIGKLVENEKVIVKITKGNNKKIKVLSMKLNSLYNFMKTYCSFSCLEDYSKIVKKYEKENSFCEKNGDKMITIEIMKKYEGSLSKFEGKLSVSQVTQILIQLLYSIMESFNKYGFIHEDLSLGNVLYRIKSKNEVIEYNLTKNRRLYINSVIGEIVPIISDYDKTESYKNDIYKKYSETPMLKLIRGYNETKTILDSISKITQNVILLLNDKDKQSKIKNKIYELFSSEKYEEYYRHTYKTLRDYVRGYKTYDEMVFETFIIFRILSNEIIKIYKNDTKFELIPQLVDNF